MQVFKVNKGYLYFLAPDCGCGPRSWPSVFIYWPWRAICVCWPWPAVLLRGLGLSLGVPALSPQFVFEFAFALLLVVVAVVISLGWVVVGERGGRSSISVFQEFFASVNKISILAGRCQALRHLATHTYYVYK